MIWDALYVIEYFYLSQINPEQFVQYYIFSSTTIHYRSLPFSLKEDKNYQNGQTLHYIFDPVNVNKSKRRTKLANMKFAQRRVGAPSVKTLNIQIRPSS